METTEQLVKKALCEYLEERCYPIQVVEDRNPFFLCRVVRDETAPEFFVVWLDESQKVVHWSRPFEAVRGIL